MKHLLALAGMIIFNTILCLLEDFMISAEIDDQLEKRGYPKKKKDK